MYRSKYFRWKKTQKSVKIVGMMVRVTRTVADTASPVMEPPAVPVISLHCDKHYDLKQLGEKMDYFTLHLAVQH